MARDFVSQIAPAVRRGATGLRSSIARFGEEATGLDFFREQREDAEADLARPELQPRVRDLRSAIEGPNPVADTAELIALGGAESLPSFALMAAGGITGRVLGGVLNSPKLGAALGASAPTFFAEGGENLAEAERRGGTPDLATASAYALPQAAAELAAPLHALRRFPSVLGQRKGILRSAGEQALITGTEEAGTEAIQRGLTEEAVAAQGAEKLTGDDYWWALADSAARGFGGGVTLGAPIGAAGAALTPGTYIPKAFKENPFAVNLNARNVLEDLETDIQTLDRSTASSESVESNPIYDYLSRADPIIKELLVASDKKLLTHLSDSDLIRLEKSMSSFFGGDVANQRLQAEVQLNNIREIDQQLIALQNELTRVQDIVDKYGRDSDRGDRDDIIDRVNSLYERRTSADRSYRNLQSRVQSAFRLRDKIFKKFEDLPILTDEEALKGRRVTEDLLKEMFGADFGFNANYDIIRDDVEMDTTQDVADEQARSEAESVFDESEAYEIGASVIDPTHAGEEERVIFNDARLAITGQHVFEALADPNELAAQRLGISDEAARILRLPDDRLEHLLPSEKETMRGTMAQLEGHKPELAELMRSIRETKDPKTKAELRNQLGRKLEEVSDNEPFDQQNALKLMKELNEADSSFAYNLKKYGDWVDEQQRKSLPVKRTIYDVKYDKEGKPTRPLMTERVENLYGKSLRDAAFQQYRARMRLFENLRLRATGAKTRAIEQTVSLKKRNPVGYEHLAEKNQFALQEAEKAHKEVVAREERETELFNSLTPKAYLNKFSLIQAQRIPNVFGKADRADRGTHVQAEARHVMTEREVRRARDWLAENFKQIDSRTMRQAVDDALAFKSRRSGGFTLPTLNRIYIKKPRRDRLPANMGYTGNLIVGGKPLVVSPREILLWRYKDKNDPEKGVEFAAIDALAITALGLRSLKDTDFMGGVSSKERVKSGGFSKLSMERIKYGFAGGLALMMADPSLQETETKSEYRFVDNKDMYSLPRNLVIFRTKDSKEAQQRDIFFGMLDTTSPDNTAKKLLLKEETALREYRDKVEKYGKKDDQTAAQAQYQIATIDNRLDQVQNQLIEIEAAKKYRKVYLPNASSYKRSTFFAEHLGDAEPSAWRAETAASKIEAGKPIPQLVLDLWEKAVKYAPRAISHTELHIAELRRKPESDAILKRINRLNANIKAVRDVTDLKDFKDAPPESLKQAFLALGQLMNVWADWWTEKQKAGDRHEVSIKQDPNESDLMGENEVDSGKRRSEQEDLLEAGYRADIASGEFIRDPQEIEAGENSRAVVPVDAPDFQPSVTVRQPKSVQNLPPAKVKLTEEEADELSKQIAEGQAWLKEQERLWKQREIDLEKGLPPTSYFPNRESVQVTEADGALIEIQGPHQVSNIGEAESRVRAKKAQKEVERSLRRRQYAVKTIEPLLSGNLEMVKRALRSAEQAQRREIARTLVWLENQGDERATKLIKKIGGELMQELFRIRSAAEAASIEIDFNRLTLPKDEIARLMNEVDPLLNATAREIGKLGKSLGVKSKLYALEAKDVYDELMKRKLHDVAARLTSGKLHALTLSDYKNGIGVFLHPLIKDAQLRSELLAHEMGHVVFRDRLATATDQEANAILNQFHKWRTSVKGTAVTAYDVFRTRKSVRAALLSVSNNMGLKVNELTEQQQRYVFDFEEWFADEAAKAISRTTAPKTLVQKWFHRLIEAFRKLVGYVRHNSVEKFINDLQLGVKMHVPSNLHIMDRLNIYNAAASQSVDFSSPDFKKMADKFQQMTGISLERVIKMDMSKSGNAMWGHIWESLLRSKAKGVGGVESRLAWMAAANKYDPYGAVNNLALRYGLNKLMPESNYKAVLRAAQTAPVKRQILSVMGNTIENERLLHNPEVAAAYMFQLWSAGQITVGAETDTAFKRASNALNGMWGVVSDAEKAETIMAALRDGVLREDLRGKGAFGQDRFEQTLREKAEAKLSPAVQKAVRGLARGLISADSRMRASGIPAFTWMADQFHSRTGNEFRNETYAERKAKMIARFSNMATKIFEGKSEEFGQEVIVVLNTPHLYRDASPEVQQAVKDVWAFMRHIREYVGVVEKQRKGFKVGDIKDKYFPWVFDVEYLQANKDKFKALLLQPKYESELRRMSLEYMHQSARFDLARWKGGKEQRATLTKIMAEIDRALNKQGADYVLPSKVRDMIKASTVEWIAPEDMPDLIYGHIVEEQGVVDTEINPSKIGHVPKAQFANKRVMKFVTDLGSEQDKIEWANFLSKKLGDTMRRYIEQITKRVEYVRLFGPEGEELTHRFREAEKAGATPEQLKEAARYVNAMLGTLGYETNQWLHNNIPFFPKPSRKGEPINPTLQKGFSGVMVYQNIRLLSLATLTSLVDPLGIAVRTGDFKLTWESFKQGIYDTAQTLKGNKTELRHLAETLGIIDQHLTNEALGWQYGGVYMSGLPKRINEAFFKYTGLTGWTKMTRVMAMAAGLGFIKKHVQRPDKHSARYLTELGIAPEDVTFNEEGNVDMWTEDKWQEMRDAAMSGDKEAVRSIKAQERMRRALYRFVDESILRPTAAQRPVWASDPHFMLIFHLKSFMYSFHDRIIRRAFVEAKEGHMMPMIGLGAFVPTMIASDMVRDVIQHGGEPPHKAGWDFADHLWNGVTRSGVTGLGALGTDAASDIQHGGWGFESLAGPTVQQALNFDFEKALPGQNLYRGWLN